MTRGRARCGSVRPCRPRTTPGSWPPLFGLESQHIPNHELPEGELPPDVAYQIIHDELMLDGNARLNLATFVTTWMEPQAAAADGRVPRQEHDRQGRVPADRGDRDALREHAQPPVARARRRPATGCSTTGSSEAAMLGGLALKRRWQKRRTAEGKPADRPNIVMGINVQICWEKFANYWDVEMRLVPMEGDRFTLSAEEAVELCDENTIGVVAILGSTFDGAYEPVERDLRRARRLPGGRPGSTCRCTSTARPARSSRRSSTRTCVWDFRLPRVASINASGHKYGLVYPGVGWVVWRDADVAARGPDLLGQLPRRQHADVRAQLLAPGRAGRRAVLQLPAPRLRRLPGGAGLRARGRDAAVRARSRSSARSSCSRAATSCRCSRSSSATTSSNFTVVRRLERAARARLAGARRTRSRSNREDLAALRVVVRRGFTHDLADLLLADLEARRSRCCAKQPAPVHKGGEAEGFHH